MSALSVPSSLKIKLGDDASAGLVEMFTAFDSRCEHRMTQEVCGLRVEMHQGFADLRHEIAQSRVEILKWMIVLWAGNLSAMLALFVTLVRLSAR